MTVGFRMSPQESDLLSRMVAISGLTKQDFIISKVLNREVHVIPNVRAQKRLEENMLYVCRGLRRLSAAGDMDPELTALVEELARTFIALGIEEGVSEVIENNNQMLGLSRECRWERAISSSSHGNSRFSSGTASTITPARKSCSNTPSLWKTASTSSANT